MFSRTEIGVKCNVTNGDANTARMVGRLFGSNDNMAAIRSRSELLYVNGIGGYRPRRIFSTSAGSVDPSNACFSVTNSYRIQPSAHTSLFFASILTHDENK